MQQQQQQKILLLFLVLFPVGSVIFLFWPSFYRVSSFDTCLSVCLRSLVRLTLTLLSVNVLGLLTLNCHVYDYGLAIVAPNSLCVRVVPFSIYLSVYICVCVCVCVRVCELVSTFNMYHSLCLSGCSLLTQ